ncbi:MAG TPA: hypothetical protein VKA89_05385 [Solirubrobacterales bacterium]|nr:hypothetical protein [Solirubrobacterales bacterium]
MAVQVAELDGVVVDQDQGADPGQGEGAGGPAAEAAAPEQEDARAEEPLLDGGGAGSVAGEVGEVDELAVVALGGDGGEPGRLRLPLGDAVAAEARQPPLEAVRRVPACFEDPCQPDGRRPAPAEALEQQPVGGRGTGHLQVFHPAVEEEHPSVLGEEEVERAPEAEARGGRPRLRGAAASAAQPPLRIAAEGISGASAFLTCIVHLLALAAT